MQNRLALNTHQITALLCTFEWLPLFPAAVPASIYVHKNAHQVSLEISWRKSARDRFLEIPAPRRYVRQSPWETLSKSDSGEQAQAPQCAAVSLCDIDPAPA